jgi:diguanylate cyclase (GGDEF)-like protein/PAS domain S-box-containing protein
VPAGFADVAHVEKLDTAQADALARALAATGVGVTVSDLRLPDQPLVYVSDAFERLAGLPAADVLGRSCRFLQGPDTDPAAVSRIRAAITRGEECRETLLNHRGPDRTPWWNELHLSPVRDTDGAVVQYIGVQQDVTARVQAERALAAERDRARGFQSRIEELGHTDPLTGLPDRDRMAQLVETALWNARAKGAGLALLLVDVDAVPTVNGTWGHAAGDELLCTAVDRLRTRVRRADLMARVGGHEVVVALLDLDPRTAREEARRVAVDLVGTVRRPMRLGGTELPIGLRVGVAVHPDDGDDFAGLLRAADRGRYERMPVLGS